MTPELVKLMARSLELQGKSKLITRDEGGIEVPYLKRYYLFRDRELAVYLHQFYSSDTDEWLHDHPWDSGNFVVAGGYNEEVFDERGNRRTYFREPGYICEKRSAESFHRVILPSELEGKGEVWTIFWRWRRRRRWGFLVDNTNWVDHEEYLGAPSHMEES